MKNVLKFAGVLVVGVALASPAAAAEHIVGGKVKSVDAEKKQVVVTDGDAKDWTITLGDDVIVNRGGKEGTSNLKADDPVHVFYEGTLRRIARYILVREGDAKSWELLRGNVKSYDSGTKGLVVTDPDKKTWKLTVADDAKVGINKEASKMSDVKIGDPVVAVIAGSGRDKTTVKRLMVYRSK